MNRLPTNLGHKLKFSLSSERRPVFFAFEADSSGESFELGQIQQLLFDLNEDDQKEILRFLEDQTGEPVLIQDIDESHIQILEKNPQIFNKLQFTNEVDQVTDAIFRLSYDQQLKVKQTLIEELDEPISLHNLSESQFEILQQNEDVWSMIRKKLKSTIVDTESKMQKWHEYEISDEEEGKKDDDFIEELTYQEFVSDLIKGSKDKKIQEVKKTMYGYGALEQNELIEKKEISSILSLIPEDVHKEIDAVLNKETSEKQMEFKEKVFQWIDEIERAEKSRELHQTKFVLLRGRASKQKVKGKDGKEYEDIVDQPVLGEITNLVLQTNDFKEWIPKCAAFYKEHEELLIRNPDDDKMKKAIDTFLSELEKEAYKAGIDRYAPSKVPQSQRKAILESDRHSTRLLRDESLALYSEELNLRRVPYGEKQEIEKITTLQKRIYKAIDHIESQKQRVPLDFGEYEGIIYEASAMLGRNVERENAASILEDLHGYDKMLSDEAVYLQNRVGSHEEYNQGIFEKRKNLVENKMILHVMKNQFSFIGERFFDEIVLRDTESHGIAHELVKKVYGKSRKEAKVVFGGIVEKYIKKRLSELKRYGVDVDKIEEVNGKMGMKMKKKNDGTEEFVPDDLLGRQEYVLILNKYCESIHNASHRDFYDARQGEVHSLEEEIQKLEEEKDALQDEAEGDMHEVKVAHGKKTGRKKGLAKRKQVLALQKRIQKLKNNLEDVREEVETSEPSRKRIHKRKGTDKAFSERVNEINKSLDVSDTQKNQMEKAMLAEHMDTFNRALTQDVVNIADIATMLKELEDKRLISYVSQKDFENKTKKSSEKVYGNMLGIIQEEDGYTFYLNEDSKTLKKLFEIIQKKSGGGKLDVNRRDDTEESKTLNEFCNIWSGATKAEFPIYKDIKSYTELDSLLSRPLKAGHIDAAKVGVIFKHLEEKGKVQLLSDEDFEEVCGDETDSYAAMEEGGDTVFLKASDSRVQHSQNLMKTAATTGATHFIAKNADPEFSDFCKKLSHETTHVLQDAGLDRDYNLRLRKFKNLPKKKQSQILENARSHFQSIGKKGDWSNPENVLKEIHGDVKAHADELESARASGKEASQHPWQKILHDFDTSTGRNPHIQDDARKRMKEAKIRGAMEDSGDFSMGGEGDEEDSFGEGDEGQGDQPAKGKETLVDADTLIGKYEDVLGKYHLFQEAASTFGDDAFLEKSSDFKKEIEEILDELKKKKDQDTTLANSYRNSANDFIEPIVDELETVESDLENYKVNSGAGYFKQLWMNTHFLCFDDMIAMGKIAYEWGERRWKRKQENKVGTIGKELFNKSRFTETLAQDFDSKVQSAENEEVNKYKDVMKDWGLDQVIDALHKPGSNKDLMKAAFMELSDRGNLEPEWADTTVWKNLSKFSGMPVYNKKTAKAAADAIWGVNSASDWTQSDHSNMESRASKAETMAKVEGGALGKQYDAWLKDLRAWNAGGRSDASLRPDYTAIMGAVNLDMKAGGIPGFIALPRIQELILLDGLPPHAVNVLVNGLQNFAPVFTLFTRGQAEKLGLFDAIGYDPKTDPYNPQGRKKLYEFMTGERALKIKYDLNSLREDRYSDEGVWMTVHDFQAGRKSGSNRTASQLGEYDQEHMDYIFPGSARYQLAQLLQPDMNGEDKLNDKRLASGVFGILKTIKAFASEKQAPPDRRKRKIKEQVRNLMQIIEYSKRNAYRKWVNELPPDSFFESNPDRTDYETHIKHMGKEATSSKNFDNRNESKWSRAVIREKSLARWAYTVQDALSMATGQKVDFASMVLETDYNESPMDKYVPLMRAIDNIK